MDCVAAYKLHLPPPIVKEIGSNVCDVWDKIRQTLLCSCTVNVRLGSDLFCLQTFNKTPCVGLEHCFLEKNSVVEFYCVLRSNLKDKSASHAYRVFIIFSPDIRLVNFHQ